MTPKIKFYHNNNCSKSRGALQLLKEHGTSVQVIEYLTAPPTEQELEKLLEMLGLEPAQIVRTGESRYKELQLNQKENLSRKEWIRILCENPILIERPIITNGTKAVIGRPPETVLSLL